MALKADSLPALAFTATFPWYDHKFPLSTSTQPSIPIQPGSQGNSSQFLAEAVWLSLLEVMVFFHLRPLEIPSVPASERHSISQLAIPHCYRLVVRYGYNDEVITPDLAAVVYEQIRLYVLSGVSKSNLRPDEKEDKSSDDSSPAAEKADGESYNAEVATLDAAFAHKIIYIIGKEQMKIKPKTNYFRKVFLWAFLWIRDSTRTKMANLNVPMDRVIEAGFLKQI